MVRNLTNTGYSHVRFSPQNNFGALRRIGTSADTRENRNSSVIRPVLMIRMSILHLYHNPSRNRLCVLWQYWVLNQTATYRKYLNLLFLHNSIFGGKYKKNRVIPYDFESRHNITPSECGFRTYVFFWHRWFRIYSIVKIPFSLTEILQHCGVDGDTDIAEMPFLTEHQAAIPCLRWITK